MESRIQALFAAKGSHVVCVFGQMNETPGCRMRVSHASISMGEYFRDQGSDLLIFIDRVSSKMMALGYQPTLSTEMGSLKE